MLGKKNQIIFPSSFYVPQEFNFLCMCIHAYACVQNNKKKKEKNFTSLIDLVGFLSFKLAGLFFFVFVLYVIAALTDLIH
jgi:hypothetical protein